MKIASKLIPLGLVLACALPAMAQEQTWTIDKAHSSVNFRVKHLMLSSVAGSFKDVSGTVEYDGKNIGNARVDANIGASSINTNIDARDEHLRSKTVFDAVQYPSITFKSEKVEPEAGGAFKIVGTLTMHGVSQPVVLSAERLSESVDAGGKQHLSTRASAAISRKSFGISVDKAVDVGGALVGDQVQVSLNIDLIRQ